MCVYKCVYVCIYVYIYIYVYVRLFATVTTEQDSVSHLAAARPFIVLYTPVYVSPWRARVTLVGRRPFRQVEPPIGRRRHGGGGRESLGAYSPAYLRRVSYYPTRGLFS